VFVCVRSVCVFVLICDVLHMRTSSVSAVIRLPLSPSPRPPDAAGDDAGRICAPARPTMPGHARTTCPSATGSATLGAPRCCAVSASVHHRSSGYRVAVPLPHCEWPGTVVVPPPPTPP
jgi:hypothetical protein